jgi:hypothetical protein
MAEYIANNEAKFKFDNQSGPSDIQYTTDPDKNTNGVTVTEANAQCPKDKKILIGQVIFVWNVGSADCPHTSSLSTFVAGGGSISADGDIKCDNQKALSEEDSGSCSGSWVNNSSGAPESCSCNVDIDDAGQDDVEQNKT